VRLIQTKVRCVEGVRDTEWFVPGRETTVIFGPKGSGKKHLLLAMEGLNPLYEITEETPFARHPEVWQQGSYTRRVIPEKKTAVFMVFSSEPDLVRELDSIDPALIETNRIEVGRRLDYSRWITFVEISASSRWSEIVEQMQQLHTLSASMNNLPESVVQSDVFAALVGTDRIKGTVADECREWLNAVGSCLPVESKTLVDKCLHIVDRAERFRTAREKVEQWLPPTICLCPEHMVQSCYSVSGAQGIKTGFDPVCALISLLGSKYGLGAGKSAEMSTAVESARLSLQYFMVPGLAVPQIRFDDQQVVIERSPARNDFEERVFRIVTVCLLTQLCFERKPLLLLEGVDNGLSVAETLEMIAWLQQLGRYCQLILTTEREMVAGAHGWQAIKLVDAGGLATGALLAG
jgi:hypothetical protein